jgi:hypothetical protein
LCGSGKDLALAGITFSRLELEALIAIESEYGQITYQQPMMLEQLFLERTGRFRASGCLYMAMWRIKQGKYNHKLYGNDYPYLPPKAVDYPANSMFD